MSKEDKKDEKEDAPKKEDKKMETEDAVAPPEDFTFDE